MGILASDPSPEVIEALVNAQRSKLSESPLSRSFSANWSGINRRSQRTWRAIRTERHHRSSEILAGSADPSVRATLRLIPGRPGLLSGSSAEIPIPKSNGWLKGP